MQMILFRHGKRDLYAPPANSANQSMDLHNVGLNAEGHKQAQRLVELLSPKGPLPRATQLLTSPKNRAIETFQPLSEWLSLNLQITTELDECSNKESATAFRARVSRFLEALPQKFSAHEVIFLCSHFDWLEEAMNLMESDLSDSEISAGFNCAEFRIFERVEGIWQTRTGIRI